MVNNYYEEHEGTTFKKTANEMNSQCQQSSQCKFDPVLLSTVAAKTKKTIRSARLQFPSGGFAVRHRKTCEHLFVIAVSRRTVVSFVTPLSLHTHCFKLCLVFLCQVLSPNSTFFDQGCVHHPHVSIAFEKDKCRQETCVMSIVCVLVCTCAL